MNAPLETSRERFLDLLVERLTLPATVSGTEDAASLLEQLARLLGTSGAYVIMLAHHPHGEVDIESRHAWYEFDVSPLEVNAERLQALMPIYRNGPLVISDSRLLPPVADEIRAALEDRGLRSALMQPVFFDDVIRGFVGFNDRHPRRWTDAELELAGQLARLVVGTLDKRQADRDLAEAEARIRSFVTETPIPVYCWEFPRPIPIDLPVEEQVAAIASGLLVECNAAYAAAYELGNVEDALGTRFGDVALLDTDRIRSDLSRFVRGGYRSLEQQSETTDGDGRRRIVVHNATGFVDDGRLYRIWGNVRDVTAIVEAEREVEAGRARVSLAVQAGGLGFFDWDPATETGTFEFAAGLPGDLPRTGTVDGGEQLADLLGSDNATSLIGAWRSAPVDGAGRTAVEITIGGGDGNTHLLFQGSPTGDEVGREGGRRIAGVIQDLTAVRRAEAEQHELEERMRSAQKLESLGLLAGGIAHDFNNLLFGIRGYAELARTDVTAGSAGEGFLYEIETAAGVASELCRQLLAYAGRGSFVLEAIDLAALIGDMRGLLESTASGATSLSYEFAPSPPIVADASQMQQIVLNLVINAAEAIGPRAGSIVVSSGVATCTAEELASPHVEHELPAGEYTFIEVRDDGSGMSADTEARLFDPFFTTKFTGRGLGMSAVLGIVRAHQGSVTVSTEEGRGTSVRVLFPAGDATATPRRSADRPGPPATLSGTTVLLVDDDPRVRAVGATMLRRMGVTVLAADSGADAMRIFAERGDEVSAVVLDLTMPEKDGVETFRELRAHRSDVRVILTSGYTEQEATRHFVGRGLAAFLQKPYAAADLHRTLETVLAW